MTQIEEPKFNAAQEENTLKTQIGIATFANSLMTCFLASWIVLLLSIYFQDFINFTLHNFIQVEDLRPLNYDPRIGGIKKYFTVLFILSADLMLLIALVLITTKLFPYFYRFRGRTKLFILWAKVFSWAAVFGTPLAAVLTRTGFYYFFYYLGMKGPFQVGISIGGLIAAFFVGTPINTDFMRTAYSRSLTGRRIKQYIFKFAVIWLPLIIVYYVNTRYLFANQPNYYLYFFYPLPILLFATLIPVPPQWVKIAKETGQETLNRKYLLAVSFFLFLILVINFLKK